ncbi:MAG: hypothetical protein QXV41_03535 [Zestosphaera sp.]
MSNWSGRRIPGMAYIVVSFVPWILYWVLCGLGFKLGVFLSLVMSFILVIPQKKWRSYNLMDLVSIIYFILASAGTYVFNLEFFVQQCGFTGYFALFLMGAFSLIVKQPFTFKVAKKDWPESYWREKSFLLINNVVSLVWTLIFIVNAILFLLTRMPYNVVFSNLLVLF